MFLEAAAAGGTTVLVVEDLHWAEEALLDFLDDLVERISAVPLLVVCTSRPELWERRPGWGGGKPNALTISLQPLTPADTQKLLEALIDPTLLAPGREDELVARAGGNPLYAQEYAHMLVEQGAETTGLPDSVQGIIAARLDALSSEEKGLLQDASVVGRTSWLGALCALGGRDRTEADELAFRLERKQLLRRGRQSSVAGEVELNFAHDLIHEVAYGQLTRAQRALRHERTAAWVQKLAGDRDDLAELVAHHLGTALELREALGEDSTGLRERTLPALVAAARQAAARHDHSSTIAFVEKALALGPEAGTRAELLVRLAVAQSSAGTATEQDLVEARDAALAAGNRIDAVQAAHLLARWAETVAADGALADRYGREALELAARLPPGPVTILPATFHAYRLEIQGRFGEAVAFAEPELARARAAGSKEAEALLLQRLGASRAGSGDVAGVDELRESYRILDRHASPSAAVAAANLGEALLGLGRAEEARAGYEEGVGWARRTGYRQYERYGLAGLANVAYHAGNAGEAAAFLDAADATGSDEFNSAWQLLSRGRLALPERPDDAVRHGERALAYAERTQNDEIRLEGLALLARAERTRGRVDAGRAACDAFLERWHALDGLQFLAAALVEAGLVLVADRRRAALMDAAVLVTLPSPWIDAARALADGRYEESAAILESIPSIPLRDEAKKLIGAVDAAPRSSES